MSPSRTDRPVLSTLLAPMFDRWPETVRPFFDRRMACVGCAMSPFETLAEAARHYAVPPAALLAEVRRAATRSPSVQPPAERPPTEEFR